MKSSWSCQFLNAFECVDLGGKNDTRWIIECDMGELGEKTDILTSVEASGEEIFLCNGRLSRSRPQPRIPGDDIWN